MFHPQAVHPYCLPFSYMIWKQFLQSKYNGLSYLKEKLCELLQDDQTEVYLNLFVLLYADDTIIISESKDEL